MTNPVEPLSDDERATLKKHLSTKEFQRIRAIAQAHREMAEEIADIREGNHVLQRYNLKYHERLAAADRMAEALDDIAKGVIPPGFSLDGPKEAFHERFSVWMQHRAREALDAYNATKESPGSPTPGAGSRD